MMKSLNQHYTRVLQGVMSLLLAICISYSNANSCQYIADAGIGFLATVKSYKINNDSIYPIYAGQIEVVGVPKIITVSEDSRYLLVTGTQYHHDGGITGGITAVYRVNSECQLSAKPISIFDWGKGYIPVAVLQNDDKFYAAYSFENYSGQILDKGMKAYYFNRDEGKIIDPDSSFADITIPVTSMAYNVAGSTIFVASRKSILGYKFSPMAPIGDKLRLVHNFKLDYTPDKILSFGNLLFAIKNDKNHNQAPYFVASYQFGDGDNLHQQQRFNVYPAEVPLDMQVTYAPEFLGYMPPGLSGLYNLVTTTGTRIYKYVFNADGILDENAMIGVYQTDFQPDMLASSWSADRYFTGIKARTPFIVTAIQNHQDKQIILHLNPEKNSVIIFKNSPEHITAPIAMAIALAPDY